LLETTVDGHVEVYMVGSQEMDRHQTAGNGKSKALQGEAVLRIAHEGEAAGEDGERIEDGDADGAVQVLGILKDHKRRNRFKHHPQPQISYLCQLPQQSPLRTTTKVQ
jgi:hypothetical protein